MAAAYNGMVDMQEPIPFLTTNYDGSFQINPEAKDILRQVGVLSTVSIAGSSRTGKSYIMNRLFHCNQGFELGDSLEAETKGIWMWAKPHPHDENITLVLLDSEGLHDPEKADNKHDLAIFSLLLLLSGTMIYNVMGKLDEAIVNELHLVTELTKHIKISDDAMRESGDDFKKYFPNLVFLIRDFFLKKQLKGKSITSKEYMENVLKTKIAPREQGSNEARECIKKYFPNRDCHALCRPIDDEEELSNLDKIDDDGLKQKFIAQSNEFVNDVLDKAIPNFLENNLMNGARFVEMAAIFVNAINDNGIPCVKRAVKIIKEEQIKEAKEGAIEIFLLKMYESVKVNCGPPLSTDKHSQLLKEANQDATTYYIQNEWYESENDQQYLDDLMVKFEDLSQQFCVKNKQASEQKCEKLLANFTTPLKNNICRGMYHCPGGSQRYKHDKEEAIQKYLQASNKGPMADHVLNDYLQKAEEEEEIIVQQDRYLTEEEKIRFLEEERRKREETKAREENEMLMEQLAEMRREKNPQIAREEQENWRSDLERYRGEVSIGGVREAASAGAILGRTAGGAIGAILGGVLGNAPGAAAGGAIGGIAGTVLGGLAGASAGFLANLVFKALDRD